MKNNPVSWFEIYVSDMPRAKAFYEAVFAVELSHLPAPTDDGLEMWAFPMEMGLPGAGGTLAKMQGVEPGGGGTLIYLECDDVAVEAARIEAAGGKLHCGKQPIGEYGFMAIGIDTEGNTFGMHSMK